MSGNQNLSINSESIQNVYSNFIKNKYIANRRYQRKLVWSIDEKQAFIDSILSKYPVPLILLAQEGEKKNKYFEIIDGMQRLDAITSFINQEFDLKGQYFNLDSIADTKLLKDNNSIQQKTPFLSREICAELANYPLPISIFQDGTKDEIDAVFQRLNSGGKHLSRQELRQAGNTSKFGTIVRKLSSEIRGDSSTTDLLGLKDMKKISITNKKLNYGIVIDEVFWVKNQILDKESLRQSKDEEIIAEIVAWVSLDKTIRSSSEILDELYGFNQNFIKNENKTLASEVNIQIQKINEENLIENIQSVFDTLIEIISISGKTFNSLIFKEPQQKITRYFQIIFLTLYQIMIEENKMIKDKNKLAAALEQVGDKIIKLSAGGGNWSAKEKESQIEALSGYLKKHFKKNDIKDPTSKTWITRLENLITKSRTEQTLYDFKVGLHPLDGPETKDYKKCISKIVKTLTAMANTTPKCTGYCIVGIADNIQTAEKWSSVFNKKYIHVENSPFYITGVIEEANKHQNNFDTYFMNITKAISQEPISAEDRAYICENIQSISYYDKELIVLSLTSGSAPSIYNEEYFTRNGSSLVKVNNSDFIHLFKKFS